jgi:uncharacterized lipoprotein YmbA
MNKLVIATVLSALFSGCASTPNVKFYVLESISQSAPTQQTIYAEKQHSIGIGPLSIPTLLQHKQIVTRSSDNTVQIAEFHQWASPLQDNMVQALTANLSTLQPNNIVRVYPWSIHGMVDLQVIVDITRFDTTLGQTANLEANWTIKNEATKTILKSGHSAISYSMPDPSYPGTVRTLSKILGEFSRELSLALLKVQTNN